MNGTLAAIGGRTLVPPGRWQVDPRHSNVEFEVNHLAITTVKGRFRDFEGALDVDGVGGVRAHGSILVESLDTGAPERDAHLLSADFLDADRHPEIRYALLALRADGDRRARALGELTIRGVTRQTVLDATLAGTVRDPWGNERLGLELRGALSRQDFGLAWNALLEGRAIVGDAVRLAIGLSLVRRALGLPPLDAPVAAAFRAKRTGM